MIQQIEQQSNQQQPQSPINSDSSSHSQLSIFNQDFYYQLIKIENKLKKSKTSLKDINTAIQYYVKLVEQYDLMQDPIKFYFQEKLQNLISKKRAFNLLGIHQIQNRLSQSRNSLALKMNLLNLIQISSGDEEITKSKIMDLQSISQSSQQSLSQNSQSSSDTIVQSDDEQKKKKLLHRNSRKTSMLLKNLLKRKQENADSNQQQDYQYLNSRQRKFKLDLLEIAKDQYNVNKEMYKSKNIVQNEMQKLDQQELLIQQIVDQQSRTIQERIQGKIKKIQQKQRTRIIFTTQNTIPNEIKATQLTVDDAKEKTIVQSSISVIENE